MWRRALLLIGTYILGELAATLSLFQDKIKISVLIEKHTGITSQNVILIFPVAKKSQSALSAFFPFCDRLISHPYKTLGKSKNSVALVRERTIPTERPPPVGEVSANFCG